MTRKTTRGLTERDLRGPAFHCAARLMERYGIETRVEAMRLYLRHTQMLASGLGPTLYASPQGGKVYRLEDEGRVFYPVRKRHRQKPQMIIVTYLAPDMVFNAMMGEGPEQFRVK